MSCKLKEVSVPGGEQEAPPPSAAITGCHSPVTRSSCHHLISWKGKPGSKNARLSSVCWALGLGLESRPIWSPRRGKWLI